MEFEINDEIVKIMVIGVGGAGNSVVNRIVKENAAAEEKKYDSIKYVVINTDKQALMHSDVANQVLIGRNTTKGQGAGSDPEKGQRAAEESEEDLNKLVSGCDLVFITAGMGGGTGTGAAHVVARVAKKAEALVISAVTTPSKGEGANKYKLAIEGINKLKEHSDALVIIDNNKLQEIALTDKKLSYSAIMSLADEPLKEAILGVAGTVLDYGNQMNTDFADIKTIMENKGLAHMGLGVSRAAEDAGIEATKMAIESTLTNTTIQGATGVIFNITSSSNLPYAEYQRMLEMVHEHCDVNVLFKQGKHEDDSLGDEVRVTLIATGVQQNNQPTGLAMDRNDAKSQTSPEGRPRTGRLGVPTMARSGGSGLSIPKGFK